MGLQRERHCGAIPDRNAETVSCAHIASTSHPVQLISAIDSGPDLPDGIGFQQLWGEGGPRCRRDPGHSMWLISALFFLLEAAVTLNPAALVLA